MPHQGDLILDIARIRTHSVEGQSEPNKSFGSLSGRDPIHSALLPKLLTLKTTPDFAPET